MPLVNIFGGSGSVFSCPAPPQGNKNLVEYMKDFTKVMKQLNATRDKETAIKRIELIKVQVLTDLGGDVSILDELAPTK